MLLLLAVEGEPDEEQAAIVRAWAEQLAASRAWHIPPPQLVDELDRDGTCTLGVFTCLLSGHSPWNEVIPVSVDSAS